MKTPFILDTGPLVAWFCPRDEQHQWARKAFTQLPAGGIICEAILTEACHLTAKEGISRSKIIEFVERGKFKTVALGNELPLNRKLLDQYSDANMDFADACVVRLSEMYPEASVCTVDQDFTFYRRNGRDSIPLIASFVS